MRRWSKRSSIKRPVPKPNEFGKIADKFFFPVLAGYVEICMLMSLSSCCISMRVVCQCMCVPARILVFCVGLVRAHLHADECVASLFCVRESAYVFAYRKFFFVCVGCIHVHLQAEQCFSLQCQLARVLCARVDAVSAGYTSVSH